MRRFILFVTAALLSVSLSAQEKPRFICGLDWGYSAGIYETHTRVYRQITTPHFAITDNGKDRSFVSLGDISVNAGMSFGRHSELRGEVGYAGISKTTRLIPTILRYGFLFKGHLQDGWMLEISAGPGWKLSGQGRNPAYLAGIRTGYRIHLGGKTCLDLKFGFQQTFDRPVLYDKMTSVEISDEYVVRNWSFRSSLRAGAALSF